MFSSEFHAALANMVAAWQRWADIYITTPFGVIGTTFSFLIVRRACLEDKDANIAAYRYHILEIITDFINGVLSLFISLHLTPALDTCPKRIFQNYQANEFLFHNAVLTPLFLCNQISLYLLARDRALRTSKPKSVSSAQGRTQDFFWVGGTFRKKN